MSGQKDTADGQNVATKQEDGACGPACKCGSTGVGKLNKWLIGGAAVLSACLVAAARFSGAKEAAPLVQRVDQPVVATAAADQPATDAARDTPRKGLSESNVMAANTNLMRRTLLGGASRSSRTIRPARVRSRCGAGGCGPKGCGAAAPKGYDLGLPKKSGEGQ